MEERMTPDAGYPDVPCFSDIPGVKPVPVVDDWKSLSREEFIARTTNEPLLLRGLGSESRAYREWDHAFFEREVKEPVTLVTEKHLGSKEYRCTAEVSMKEFVSFLDGPDRVYLREWYLFRKHPRLIQHVIDTFPPYLLDDWMEVIPNGWALNRGTRNNVYWGSHGTRTPFHFDTLNTVTWNVTIRGVKRWLLFSAREVEPGYRQLLGSLGVARDGFITPEGIARYLAERPPEIPGIEFYTVDVPAGSTLFIPWKWAHQVHNMGECLAVSRYYISAENYEACSTFVRRRFGPVAATAFRGLVGTEQRRRFWKNPPLRKLAESKAACRSFFFLLYMAGLGQITDNFLTPDEKE
jgi:hypothetical protein